MANMLTSRDQKRKQQLGLEVKSRRTGEAIRRAARKQEEYFVKRLSDALGTDLEEIVEGGETVFEREYERVKPHIERQKKAVRTFGKNNRRRFDQAIKSYDKSGLIESLHRLYPNQPNLRMKFANDWEGTCSPTAPPGIGEYAVADIQFEPELNADGEVLPVPGHDGLCKRFGARAHAVAGGRRFGHKTATTEQTLVFRHDPPPSVGDAQTCAINEVWVPMTVNGLSSARRSSAIFFTQSLAFSGGGVAEVRLSIDVEQDTSTRPLVFPVVTRELLFGDYERGSQWLFGGSPGTLFDGPRAIDVEIAEPYRLPVILRTADHGGGEVRVVVKLATYADAEHRGAEAEIDLTGDGFGVVIHEVLLHVAAYIGW